jgi:hypothetical protein
MSTNGYAAHKYRDPRLGPILPFCGCGDNRYWYDFGTRKAWLCWTCAPPGPIHGPRGEDVPQVDNLKREETAAYA